MDVSQLNSHRLPDGRFGAHEHTAPGMTLSAESGRSDGLFEFDFDGRTLEVSSEGDGVFSVHDMGGQFVTNFSFAGDTEDHYALEDAAIDALAPR